MKTVDERVQSYLMAEKYNDLALKSILKLREAFDKKNSAKVMQEYGSLVNYICSMAQNYGVLSGSYSFKKFFCNFERIETKTRGSLENALHKMDLKFSHNFNLYENIEKLQSDLVEENFLSAKTLHDLIRVLHKSSLINLFSFEEEKENFKKYFLNSGTFSVLMGENTKKSVRLLQPMFDFYMRGVSTQGKEKYFVLLTQDQLFSRIKLGCHYSYLDVALRKFRGDINFKFVNTSPETYEGAPRRAAYVEGVLKNLGYENVEHVSETDVVANLFDVGYKRIFEILGETTRLLASTKNLDNTSLMGWDIVPKAVEAFSKGKTDISSLLGEL